jgi:NADH-quinone oxidoreductase subunit M
VTVHLSILIFLPFAAAVVGLLLPAALVRAVAVAGTLLALAYAIVAVADFDSASGGLQFVTNDRWISELGIRWKLGIDGLNVFLVLLTCVLWTASTVWASLREWERPKLFFFHMGLAQTAVLGALIAQDLALFVVFFDLMLVPFFFLTGQWGSGDRVRATTKLVIYTLVGSLLMLSAAVALGVLSATGDQSVTFEISALVERTLPKGTQEWIFLFFAAAFLVKMPAFPLHGWMPDGYTSMPMPVLAVFSGVLSKVAAYGFLRICLPVLPDASAHYQEFMLVIALLSILYGSVMAFTTTNARLVLGYSSVAQLGFIVLGIFALRDAATQGSLLQAVNHGLIVVPAFFVVALLAERVGSEDLRDMGGLALRAPVLAAMALIVTFGVLAMPGSANFIGEFMILLGAFESKIVYAIVASTGVVLAAVYALRLFILAFHNNRGDERVGGDRFREISFRDGLVLIPLVAAVIALSLYPQIALHRSERSATQSVAAAKAIASGEAAASREVTP